MIFYTIEAISYQLVIICSMEVFSCSSHLKSFISSINHPPHHLLLLSSRLPAYEVKYFRLHWVSSGLQVNITVSLFPGPWFKPKHDLLFMWIFACSPCVLWVLGFPISQNHVNRWIGYTKMCVHNALHNIQGAPGIGPGST